MASAVAFLLTQQHGLGCRRKKRTTEVAPSRRRRLTPRQTVEAPSRSRGTHGGHGFSHSTELMIKSVAILLTQQQGLGAGGRRGRLKSPTPKTACARVSLEFRHSPQNGTSARRPRLQPWLSIKPFSRSQDSEVSWRALRMSPEYREGRNTRFTMGRNPFSTISTSCSASWSAFSQPSAKPGARSVIKRTARS